MTVGRRDIFPRAKLGLSLVAAFLLAGCDLCFLGSSPDPPPERSIVLLDLSVGADSSSTGVEKARRIRHEGWRLESEAREGAVSINKDMTLMLVGRRLFTPVPLSAEYIPAPTELPDSLSFCMLTPADERMLCTVTGADTIRSASGQSLRIAAGRTSVAWVDDAGVTTLLNDTARFYAADRYRIDRPERLQLSADGSTALALISRETRRIVTNEAGEVVNDYAYASDRILVVVPLHAPGDATEMPRELLEGADDNLSLAVSPGGAFVATEQAGTIRLVQPADTSRIQTFEGWRPQLSEDRLIANPERNPSGEVLLYSLPNGEQERVTLEHGGQLPALDPDRDRVYYVTSGPGIVQYYDPATRRHKPIFDVDAYSHRQDDPDKRVRSYGARYLTTVPGGANVFVAAEIEETRTVSSDC